jgi:hypothetical protein
MSSLTDGTPLLEKLMTAHGMVTEGADNVLSC